jgi:hypothetical protein
MAKARVYSTLLYIAIACIVLLLIRKVISKIYIEQFTVETYPLKGCPPGFKPMTNMKGETICCGGDIVMNTCKSNDNLQCIVSNTVNEPTNIIPCPTLLNTIVHKMCPKSMKTYFLDPNKGPACTAASQDVVDRGDRIDKDVCYVYRDMPSRIENPDSCYLNKQLSEAICIGSDCKRAISKLDDRSNRYAPMVTFSIDMEDNKKFNWFGVPQKYLEDYLLTYNKDVTKDKKTFNELLTKNPFVLEVMKASLEKEDKIRKDKELKIKKEQEEKKEKEKEKEKEKGR